MADHVIGPVECRITLITYVAGPQALARMPFHMQFIIIGVQVQFAAHIAFVLFGLGPILVPVHMLLVFVAGLELLAAPSACCILKQAHLVLREAMILDGVHIIMIVRWQYFIAHLAFGRCDLRDWLARLLVTLYSVSGLQRPRAANASRAHRQVIVNMNLALNLSFEIFVALKAFE